MAGKSILASFSALAFASVSTLAEAVNLSTSDTGDLAVAPYYTVRDGWQTLVNLTNTGESPIMVKVRFREGMNGRDVLNFNVALAGFDVFTGVLREASNGSGPVFVSTDQADTQGRRSCTVPASVGPLGSATPLSTRGFGPPGTPDDDGGPSGSTTDAIDRLREGSIEFFVLGYAEGADQGAGGGGLLAIGDAIESHSCSVFDTAFSSAVAGNGQTHIVNTARQFGEPINVLKANIRLLNAGRGTEAGLRATTWANFYNRDDQPNSLLIRPSDNSSCVNTADRYFQYYDNSDPNFCRNLITAQELPAALVPTLNSGYPPLAHAWIDDGNLPLYGRPVDFTYPVITQVPPAWRSVDAVSITIQRQAMTSEWSADSNLGVTTDWIVTFPTKGFYVDRGAGTGHQGRQGPSVFTAIEDQRQAGNDLDNYETEPYPPFQSPFGQRTAGDRSSAASCNDVTLTRVDRADQLGSPLSGQLCYAANVVTFSGRSALSPARPLDVGLLGLAGDAGWMRIDLDAFSGAGIDVEHIGGPLDGELSEYRGLPVIGANIKQRNFGDVSKNFASSVEHGYRVEMRQMQ